MEKNPTENGTRKISQLFTYLKYIATKYLKKRVNNVTHKNIVTNIIKKQ